MYLLSWVRHQIKAFSALLAPCDGNPLVPDGFPSQRPVTQSFHFFVDLPEQTFEQAIETLVIRGAIALIIMSLLLAKIYNFGKYVRLSVCYLPKFTIFGKYVRLSVCLSVCLSVSLSVLSSITHERFDISSPNLVHIWNGWAVPVCDIDK